MEDDQIWDYVEDYMTGDISKALFGNWLIEIKTRHIAVRAENGVTVEVTPFFCVQG